MDENHHSLKAASFSAQSPEQPPDRRTPSGTPERPQRPSEQKPRPTDRWNASSKPQHWISFCKQSPGWLDKRVLQDSKTFCCYVQQIVCFPIDTGVKFLFFKKKYIPCLMTAAVHNRYVHQNPILYLVSSVYSSPESR